MARSMHSSLERAIACCTPVSKSLAITIRIGLALKVEIGNDKYAEEDMQESKEKLEGDPIVRQTRRDGTVGGCLQASANDSLESDWTSTNPESAHISKRRTSESWMSRRT